MPASTSDTTVSLVSLESNTIAGNLVAWAGGGRRVRERFRIFKIFLCLGGGGLVSAHGGVCIRLQVIRLCVWLCKLVRIVLVYSTYIHGLHT